MISRLRQVAYYLFARRLPAEPLAWALAALGPGERRLFWRMHPADRAHGLRVACRLRPEGPPPAVVAAALLHDAGKPRVGYGLAARSLGVLLPVGRWGRVYREHGEWGLALAEAAGAGADTLALMRGHESGSAAPGWGARLRKADDLG